MNFRYGTYESQKLHFYSKQIIMKNSEYDGIHDGI
jgi:hypothetical protein